MKVRKPDAPNRRQAYERLIRAQNMKASLPEPRIPWSNGEPVAVSVVSTSPGDSDVFAGYSDGFGRL